MTIPVTGHADIAPLGDSLAMPAALPQDLTELSLEQLMEIPVTAPDSEDNRQSDMPQVLAGTDAEPGEPDQPNITTAQDATLPADQPHDQNDGGSDGSLDTPGSIDGQEDGPNDDITVDVVVPLITNVFDGDDLVLLADDSLTPPDPVSSTESPDIETPLPSIDAPAIEVEPIIDSTPDAIADSAATNEDTAVVVTVLGNDSDPDGDPLSVSAVTQGTNGSVVINGDNTVTYTPNANFNGADSFTYTITDGNGGSDTATVNVTVNAINDAPSAVTDSAATNEDTATVVTVLGNDSDPESDPLNVSSITQGSNGSVVINGDNTVTYTPNANFNGADSFTYTISDGNGGSDTATVNVTVNPVNDAPTAGDDSATTNVDTAAVISVLGNDSDPESDPLNVSTVTQGTNGTVVINVDNTVTYTPNAGYTGADSFTYTIDDGNGASDTATVNITVNAVNNFAVGAISDTNAAANSVAENAANGTAVGITALASDADGTDTVTYTLSDNAGGRFAIDANSGVVTVADGSLLDYEAATSHSIEVTATSTDGSTSLQSYTVNLTDVAEGPVAKDDGVPTDVDTAVVITVLANDSGGPLSVTLVTQGANGTVGINGDNTVTYTPNASYTGTDTFTYTADDGNGGTDTGTVTVYVGIAIEGTPSGETIQGTNGVDIIFGLDGNDTLQGKNGDDKIYGGDGNDTLNGQGGSDALFGGAGDDILVWDSIDTVIDGDGGTDTLNASGADVDITTFAGTITGIEQIDLSAVGNQSVILTAQDVLDMSDTDILTITGGPPDTVDAGTGWTDGGIVGSDHVYTQVVGTDLATLIIDPTISVNGDILS